MFDPREPLYAEQRKRDLLQQARLQQIARDAEAHPEVQRARWLAMLGDLMIAGGSELKRRAGDAGASAGGPAVIAPDAGLVSG
ncbi:MAG: hypothetical protein GYB67_15090 [Chloroflexi bacterium]|nr:hypothetical protein [Chloroflexota bacterium]